MCSVGFIGTKEGAQASEPGPITRVEPHADADEPQRRVPYGSCSQSSWVMRKKIASPKTIVERKERVKSACALGVGGTGIGTTVVRVIRLPAGVVRPDYSVVPNNEDDL